MEVFVVDCEIEFVNACFWTRESKTSVRLVTGNFQERMIKDEFRCTFYDDWFRIVNYTINIDSDFEILIEVLKVMKNISSLTTMSLSLS